MAEKATARPWKIYDPKMAHAWPGIEGVDSSVVVFGENEEDMAGVRGNKPGEALANARLIVQAVNSHDALVDALEQRGEFQPWGDDLADFLSWLADRCERWAVRQGHVDCAARRLTEAAKRIREALALAKQEAQ